MHNYTDVTIIGGGISGLATAWWLAQKGIKSTILEKSNNMGGLIDSTDKDGYLTDHAASMILNFNADVNYFIQQSGLMAKKVIRNNISKRFIIKDDALFPIPNNIRGLMLSSLFSKKTKCRLMTEPFRRSCKTQHESVADFIRRRLGDDILELAIDPYVSAVLSCDPELACARSTLPRLKALEDNFGSITAGILSKKLIPGKKGPPQESFAFEGGMKTLINELTKNPLCTIKTGQHVNAVEPNKKGWIIHSSSAFGEQQTQSQQLVFSTPAPITAQLIKPQSQELSKLLSQINYSAINQVHLGFDQSALKNSMQGNGFLVPSHSNIGIRGSLWMSNLIKNRAPDNKFLCSNFIGGACQTGTEKLTNEQLTQKALTSLDKLIGLKQDPEMVRINRHYEGLPLYHGDYYQLSQAISQTTQQLNGVHLVANYQYGISIRDRIIHAKQVTQKINQQIRSKNSIKKYDLNTLNSGLITS